MSVSTDPSTDAPVEVVCTAGDIPFVAEGRLRRFEDGAYTIDLDRDASSLGVGSSAILNFLDGITPRSAQKIPYKKIELLKNAA